MGLWGFIKRLMGFGKDERYPYGTPFYITYGSRDTDSDFWKQRKRELDEQLEWARIKRSRYG